MKKFYTLFLCSLAIAFASCDKNDENPEAEALKFGDPSVTDIADTSAKVSCKILSGAGWLDSFQTGFAYGLPGSGDEAFTYVSAVRFEGTTMTGTLTGLTAGTNYEIFAYARVGDSYLLKSQSGSFTTTGAGTPPPDELTFGTPAFDGVTKDGATLTCSFAYTGTEAVSEAYFLYNASAGADQRANLTADPGAKTASLTGLTPSTAYTFRLCVVIGGETYKSSSATFTTSPDDGVTVTPARYAGWAELPSEVSKPGEYYFAYHLCPDVYVSGNGSAKRRNYSVCYSNELKCAIWVAAPMHDCYTGDSGRTNAYKNDPDISISQPGSWSGYTRGHMLGSAERTISAQTNRQVFFHSNIAPQLGQPYFNTGGGAWNTIEDWVDTQWEGQRDTTYQVIGCYWANKNKKVNGTTIPTHYYKILLRTKGHKNKWVKDCSRDELQCIAIMVEHRTYSKNEVAKPSEYESKGMLYTVKEMEEKTGQTFFANIPNAPKDTYNTSDWGL